MGDRDRIGWDFDDRRRGDDGDGGPGEDAGGRPTRRARVTLAFVVLAVFLATIVLCCIAAGEVGQLLWLELPPP